MTRMGMLAGPGVVDRVAIDPAGRSFDIHTIGEMPPVGICGSGVIDLAAQLFRSGHDRHPRQAGGRRLRRAPAGRRRHPAPGRGPGRTSPPPAQDLTIGQADLDSLVRSKAAMYTILETLAMTVGLSLERHRHLLRGRHLRLLHQPALGHRHRHAAGPAARALRAHRQQLCCRARPWP
ncbi:MAG: ATP-binding protein [Desulfobacterales bacterium]|nr:ATP-binding protein [Desulfobacterales bacterium]